MSGLNYFKLLNLKLISKADFIALLQNNPKSKTNILI